MLTLLVVSVEVHFQLTTHMDSFFLWFLRQINAPTTIAKAITTTVATITGKAIVTDCVADCVVDCVADSSDWPEKRRTIKVVKCLSAALLSSKLLLSVGPSAERVMFNAVEFSPYPTDVLARTCVN